jgi:hypothetical protein
MADGRAGKRAFVTGAGQGVGCAGWVPGGAFLGSSEPDAKSFDQSAISMFAFDRYPLCNGTVVAAGGGQAP